MTTPAISSTDSPRPDLRFVASPIPFIVDVVVRWCTLFLRNLGWLPEMVFWLIQVVVLPAVVIAILITREDRLKRELAIPEKTGLVPDSSFFPALAGLLTLIGTVVVYDLYPTWSKWGRVLLALVAFVTYGLYNIALTLSVAKAVPRPDKAGPVQAWRDSPPDWIDSNDATLARIESQRLSLLHRVETYTLEASLFGTLTFSAFVALVADYPLVLATARDVLVLLTRPSPWVSSPQALVAALRAAAHSDQDHYLAVVALLSLACSVLFLCVMVARVRFSEAIRRVDYALQLLRGYEAKEEETHLALLEVGATPGGSPLEARLAQLGTRVTESVYYADEALKELQPVVRYMTVFRSCAVLSFVAALVFTAAAVTPLLAAGFGLLLALALLYPGVDRRIRDAKWRTVKFFHGGALRLGSHGHTGSS